MKFAKVTSDNISVLFICYLSLLMSCTNIWSEASFL